MEETHPLTPNSGANHFVQNIGPIQMLVHEWYLQTFVLGSLILQVLLLSLGTYRKRTSNFFVQYLLLGVYESSPLVANAGFLLIVGAQKFSPAQMPYGLWAAFMLLHLTGQERLTVYSLEDCKASGWLNFFKSVAAQFFVYFWVGISGREHLPFLTAIIFSVALIRLLARTLRLRFGTPDMRGTECLPAYFQFILDDDKRELQLSDDVDVVDDVDCVLNARCLLRRALRVIAGIEQGRGRGRDDFSEDVRKNFIKMKAEDAIRIVEIELSFIYDSFYTDGIIREGLSDRSYLIYTCLSSYPLLCCVITLVTFLSWGTRGSYSRANLNVTVIMLWGTLVLEVLSYVMMVFSDWTVASLGKKHGKHILLSPARHSRGSARSCRQVLFRRWSETISTFSFLAYSIKQPQQMPVDLTRPDVFLGFPYLMRNLKFVSSKWYTDSIGCFLFNQLKVMNHTAAFSKGSYILDLVTWHLTTEVLYHHTRDAQDQSPDRQHSKLLSDYMAYLLFTKLRPMCGIGSNPVVDIEEARISIQKIASGQDFNQRREEFCRKIIDQAGCDSGYNWTAVVNTIAEVTSEVPGTPDKQICWNNVSSQWVKLLLFAAIEIDPIEHVKGLCEGGELLTLVWLLAFHFGLF